jgi:predicted aspartyl protease
MHRFRLLAAGTFILGLALYARADSSNEAETADNLFREGKFADAEAAYAKIQVADDKNFKATRRLGSVALLKNDLASAERWLTKAAALKPDDKAVKGQLALVYYRRDDFAKAAPLYRDIGAEPVAKKLESFNKEAPYRIEGKAEISSIPFVHTDPLPLIQVKVKDQTANFLIDTGAPEIFLDPELAKKVGAAEFGAVTGTYSGGMQADTVQGRVENVTLGDFVIRNVPVLILSTRHFNAVAHGKKVEGILGTVMLSHFLVTLDYPKSQLILRRKTAENLKKLEEQVQSAKGITIPFWMAGEHYMVAWGQVNKSKPMLFFVDTGVAGGGFICPESTMKEAAIKLPEGQGVEGVGGGGRVKIRPFKVDELSLGAAKAKNIAAFAGAFPPQLEEGLGFHLGGFISHQFFRPYALTFDFTGMRLFIVSDKSAGSGSSGNTFQAGLYSHGVRPFGS